MEQIKINPKDFKSLIELMDKHGDSTENFYGKNINGENTTVAISQDKITVHTYQKNGWKRINIYHRDGTCEELFDGKERDID